MIATIVALLALCSTAAWSASVRWEMDNHETLSGDWQCDDSECPNYGAWWSYNYDVTMSTDSSAVMTEEPCPWETGAHAGGDHLSEPGYNFMWENETGTGTVRLDDSGNGRDQMYTPDLGSGLDFNTGVVIEWNAKCKINSDSDSNGNVAVFAENDSTQDLSNGEDSVNIWFGAERDAGSDYIVITDRGAHGLARIQSTVALYDVYATYRLYGTRVANDICWDLYVNGAGQGRVVADSLGGLHTWINGESSDAGTRVKIGNRDWNANGQTTWDYLEVGTIPEPGSLLALASGLIGLGVIRRRR